MITSVQTLSLAQARKWWDDLRESGVLDEIERGELRLQSAWIGLETCCDRSPLRDVVVGHRLIARCVDWDIDGRDRLYGPPPVSAPTIELARLIVRFGLDLQASTERHRLVVHSHAWLDRLSSAVAEWVRSDLGVPEPPTSNRLAYAIGDIEEQRIYNDTLLRLLREAHAEMKNGGAK